MTPASPERLPPASVLGIGAVTPLGRDLETIAQRLAQEPMNANRDAAPAALTVDEALLADAAIAPRLRRAGRLERMAVTAARDAWLSAQGSSGAIAPQDVGVIVATGLGPHVRTFRFLDGILDFSDASASPTDFSHSVHNVAAAYITEILQLRSRSCTIADFETAFEQAVQLAQCWLAEESCQRVLVGAVEEVGEVMLHVLQRMLPPTAGGCRAGEGAVFLTLGPQKCAGQAWIAAGADGADLDIVDEPELAELARHPSGQARAEATARPVVTFSPFFGTMATSSAFNVLGGLLSLSHGRALGIAPRRSQPGGTPATLVKAMTIKRLFNGDMASLLLTKA